MKHTSTDNDTKCSINALRIGAYNLLTEQDSCLLCCYYTDSIDQIWTRELFKIVAFLLLFLINCHKRSDTFKLPFDVAASVRWKKRDLNDWTLNVGGNKRYR